MLKQNMWQCKEVKSSEKGSFCSTGNVNKCKKYLGGREKFKMSLGIENNGERGLPGLDSFRKGEKNSWIDAESVNKDESLEKVMNLSRFRKFANFVTGRKKGKLSKRDRLPYLSKNNYKFYQFVIEENLDEDNEEFEHVQKSFRPISVLSPKQYPYKERHIQIV